MSTLLLSDRNETKQGHCLTAFQRKLLQKALQEDLPEQYHLRLQIMLLADEAKTQTQICHALGCSQATARHWMAMARSGLAHNWKDTPVGRPKTVDDQYLERLKELVSNSPRDYGYSFRRWTAQWLSKHLAKELGIQLSARHINRLLKQMGLSTRPKPALDSELTPQEGTPLLIGDLASTSASQSSALWPFNSRSDKAGLTLNPPLIGCDEFS